MGTIKTLQSNLNKGELDPLLLGRSDLDSYYAGCQTAENVVCLPQGGLSRRPGLKYINEVSSAARIEKFSFNTEQQYLLVFENNRMEIYKEGVLQTNINGSGNDYLTTTITSALLDDMDYTQSADTIIITHPDLQPHSITRTSDTDWTYTAITLSNIPQYDYNDSSSPAPTDEVQSLTFTDVNASDRYKLSVDDFLTEEIVYSSDATDNQNRIRDALHGLANTAKTGITVTGSGPFTITFGGDSAGPYGLVTATPINTELATFEGVSTRTTPGVSRKEDSWSAGRGWPVSSTFHSGRLWFGGSKSRPSAIWGSVIGDFFNFDKGKARDDELVELVIDADEINAVKHLISNRKLQIFTSGQHFYIPTDVITPSSVSVISVGNEGAGDAQPVKLDEDILYSNRTGKRLNRFSMTNKYQPTETINLSVLASHLISSPVKMAAARGTTSTDANYVYVINDDGTVAVLNTLKYEGVEGFTKWTTDGSFKSVAVVDDLTYFLVQRGAKFYIEQADEAVFFDSAVVDTSTDTVDMSHLDTALSLKWSVYGKADGYAFESQVLSASDGTDYEFGSTYTNVQAGLEVVPTIKTMPVNLVLGDGPQVSKKKRKRRAFIRVYETAGLQVDSHKIRDRSMDGTAFSAPLPATEQKLVKLRGYDRDCTVTITQYGPFPMTVLSINLEVSL